MITQVEMLIVLTAVAVIAGLIWLISDFYGYKL